MNSAEEIPRLLCVHSIIVNDFLCSKNSSESFVLLPFFTFSFFLPHLTLTLSIIKHPTQIRVSPAYTLFYIIMQYARRFLPKKRREEKNVDCNFQALLAFNYGCHNNHNEGALEWPAEGGLWRGRGYVSRTCCVPGWKI